MTVQQGDPAIPGKFASVWIDTTPGTNFPAMGGNVEADVAVLGGGIVGIVTALFLKEAGQKVVLIDASRLATGVTGHTTAKVTTQHGVRYEHLRSTFGKDGATTYAEANQAALDRIADLVQRYRIDCDFVRTPSYLFAESRSDRDVIRKEAEASVAAGLPAAFIDDVPLPVEPHGAVVVENQARFHPRKFLLPIAQRLTGDGSLVFENTRAFDVQEGEPCIVTTDRGEIRAVDVVTATHVPFFKQPGFFFSRLSQIHAYVLGLYLRGQPPDGVFYGTHAHTVRVQPTSQGMILLMGGEEHKTGQGGDIIARYGRLADYYCDRFDIDRIEYHWSTQDADTLDGVPYIGRASPGAGHLYVASGFHGWGMTSGVLSAMIISDLILGKANPWASFFDPNRKEIKASAPRFLTQAVNLAGQFVAGKTKRRPVAAPAELEPGEGMILQSRGKTIGAYKDYQGSLRTVTPNCTFEGCTLSWNNAEKTWDCPCCGSRFASDGAVILGPATHALKRADAS